MRLKIPEHCPQKQKKHNKIDSQKYTHISMLTTLQRKILRKTKHHREIKNRRSEYKEIDIHCHRHGR